MPSTKVVILGGDSVGKTSIARWLMPSNNKETDDFDAEEQITHVYENFPYSGELHIHDTTWSDKSTTETEILIRNSYAFIVVFSIASQISFDEARKTIYKLQELHGTALNPMVLVACRNDLDDHREVTISDIEDLAKLCNCSLREISVTDKDQVLDVFNCLIQEIHKQKEKEKVDKEKKSHCCLVM